ncbi:MAG TPA: hypothetical protein VGJ15_04645 [Pirellulales bacterium]
MLKIRNLTCVLAAMAIFSIGLNSSSAANSPAANPNSSATAAKSAANVSLVSTSTSSSCAPKADCKTYKPCCISYCGCCDCCGPKTSQVLKVKDPCDCCCECAEIPVCLPACCKNPCVSSRCALFGRSIVTYSYDCCCVTIVFRRGGDVVVKYD